MQCPMCRAGLDVTAQANACQACPLYHIARGCRLRLVRCPRCGYHSLPAETPARPQATLAIEPFVLEDCSAACRLGDLATGTWAHLLGFDSLDEKDLHRLVAYGLVPGVHLKLLQRVPAYILKIHETELALEHTLAKAIYVLSDPHQPTSQQSPVSL